MQNTTADYKIEINKPSRSFECKITIGDNIYKNEDLVNLTLEYTQPQESFSIGGTISKSLDLTLLNKGDIIYSTSQIKIEIGLKIGSTIEYILMGIFNIDDIEKTDYTTKFTCYDNMIKFESAYYSELGDKPTLQQVVNELSSKTGVEFTGSLPAYTVSKLDGFSCREVLSYVASICGGNAIITRDGKFTIKTLGEVEKSIDGNNYFDYTREEVKYKVGQISCQIDENNILSKGSIGTDSMELGFENPWITETILTEIYNKLKSVEYLGYSMKWQGDLSLDPYDIITVTDVKNVVRNIPILRQKLSYTGGLTSEIGAKGESKNKNSFSSSGSTTNKVNRLVTEQAVIKEALIEKANIQDLEASNAKIENLEAKTAKIEEAIIDVAHIKDLNAINANIENLIAADATINNALIGKADITELNAVKATINVLEADTANIKNLLAGNITGENIQAGGITSDKLTIANGFITNAMIANLDVAKINAGDISTNKFRIVSDSGKMLIADNTIQIRDNNRVRVQIGKDASNDYSMYVWDSAGKLMFDATGLKADGIKNNIIRDDMISDNANIDGSKINISSLVTEINKDTNTTVIKSSKVQIDSLKQTLDVAFNSLKTQADSTKSLTESHSTTINVMQGQIATAINNTQIVKDGQTILLKDDYNRTVAKVDSINSTIGSHTTKLDQLTGSITSVDTKVNSIERDLEGTKSTVSSHSTSISDLSSKVSTQGSSISQLQNQISLKVEATDVANAIKNVQVGVRNLVKNSPTLNNSFGQLGTFRGTRTILDDASAKSGKVIKIECTTAGIGFYCNLWSGDDSCIGKKYTWSFYAKMNKDKTLNNIGHERGGGTTIAVTTEWKKFTYTWTYSSTGNRSVIFYPNFAVGDIFYIKDFKIEEGDKDTDWTPAPEDIDSSISTVDGKITTTSNKVAAIETNLSSITSRVSSTESTVTTINGNVTSLQSRMTTAEQKITPTAITTTISSAITGGTGSISTTQFIMDKNGLTINNGALTIKNKSGTTVLNSDTNGNLIVTGTIKSQSGDMFVSLDSGGISLQDWNKKEQMLRIGISYFSSDRNYNGTTFAMPLYADFLRFSHISKADLTSGWASVDTQYNFLDFWSDTRTINGTTFKKGINIYAPAYINNGLFFNNTSSNVTSDIKGNLTWNNGSGNTNNLLAMCGDNGLFLGYKSGETYQARIVLTEGVHPGTGDNIRSWGNWNLSEGTIHNGHFNGKSLTISGSKNCLQETKNYGSRLINAYETAEYYFGDLGFGKISEDGECLIYIEDIFSECINTNVEYHIFTQAYNGSIKTIERYKTYFIVKGDQGTKFSWEIKAKRKGYENNRLDLQDIETQFESGLELFGEEDFKVKTSEDALLNSITFELENLLLMEGYNENINRICNY